MGLPTAGFLVPLSCIAVLNKVYALVKASAGLIIRNVVLRTKCRNFAVFRLNGINVFITVTNVLCLFTFSSELLPSIHASTMGLSRRPRRRKSLRQIRTMLNTHFPNVGGGLNSFGFGQRCKTRIGRVGHDNRDVIKGLRGRCLHRKSALIIVTSSSFMGA